MRHSIRDIPLDKDIGPAPIYPLWWNWASFLQRNFAHWIGKRFVRIQPSVRLRTNGESIPACKEDGLNLDEYT